MQKTKPPYLLIALFVICTGLLIYIILRPANVPPATKKQVKAIEKVKDSIITKAKIKSNNQVARAAAITKSLPREKPIIRDTTYAAMCEYITSYRAANAATIPSP